MLHREIIAVCSQIHTKHINTLCGQNVESRCYRYVILPALYLSLVLQYIVKLLFTGTFLL